MPSKDNYYDFEMYSIRESFGPGFYLSGDILHYLSDKDLLKIINDFGDSVVLLYPEMIFGIERNFQQRISSKTVSTSVLNAISYQRNVVLSRATYSEMIEFKLKEEIDLDDVELLKDFIVENQVNIIKNRQTL